MNAGDVLTRLEALADRETLDGMSRYGIPKENALGVPMRLMKGLGKETGPNHSLALDLWQTGVYEARTVAVFVDAPAQ